MNSIITVLSMSVVTCFCAAMEMIAIKPTNNLMTIPHEVQCHIVSFLINKTAVKKSLKDLINLSKTNKSFYELIRHKMFNVPILATEFQIPCTSVLYFIKRILKSKIEPEVSCEYERHRKKEKKYTCHSFHKPVKKKKILSRSTC